MTKIKSSERYDGTIQLRTKKCTEFAVHVNIGGNIIKEEHSWSDFTNSQNTYLNPERARKLAFALLSAAKKVERKNAKSK